ncbi:MAG: hypothetical protein R3E73_00975 [Porticoccaceae bacterium]|nr:hypothetical protein [Pseudomonadales bacterium]MCP5170682.1 hypothetical protein [Pseudomonadales bacterium]
MRAHFCINNLHPALAGHFPDNPIVPAALILEEITEAFFKLFGIQATTLQQVRFLLPLKPEKKVTIAFHPCKNHEYRFSCISGDNIITKGIINSSPVIPEKAHLEQWPDHCLTSTEGIYQRLPHAGEMCLLSAVTHPKPDTFIAIARSAHSPLNNNDALLGWSSFEYAAQAFACKGVIHHLHEAPYNHSFQGTMITRLKAMRCYKTRSNYINAPLVTTIKLAEALNHVARCEFRVFYGDNIISSGQFDAVF